MRLQSQKANAVLSEGKREESEEKKSRGRRSAQKDGAIPSWMIWFMSFVVLGSTVLQLYYSITSSPKMKD